MRINNRSPDRKPRGGHLRACRQDYVIEWELLEMQKAGPRRRTRRFPLTAVNGVNDSYVTGRRNPVACRRSLDSNRRPAPPPRRRGGR